MASGFQIISTSTVTLLLASLGFLSPASRGALLTATIVVYIWLAVVAGFTGVYLWGLMERSYSGWPYICALVSVFFPGIVLLIFTFLNLVIYHTGEQTEWAVVSVAMAHRSADGFPASYHNTCISAHCLGVEQDCVCSEHTGLQHPLSNLSPSLTALLPKRKLAK